MWTSSRRTVENVAAGKVMYQNPSEGVQCVSGTKVTITLSKGAAPAPTEQVAVPNVVTLTLEQAQGVLESAGLACKFAGGGRGHGRRAEHCGRHQGRSRVDGDRQARDSSHRFGGRAGCLTSCSYKSATRGRANG